MGKFDKAHDYEIQELIDSAQQLLYLIAFHSAAKYGMGLREGVERVEEAVRIMDGYC